MLTRQALFSPTSIIDLLLDSPASSKSPEVIISSATIRPNGTPFLQLSNGTAYAYDMTLLTWVEISSSWWAGSSPIWTKTRAGSSSSRGVVASLETTLNELRPEVISAAESSAGKARPKWWADALTLGHLETRMHACVLLDSGQEYKTNLLLYAKKLADEAYQGKAEELVKEMYGPVY